jgi:hypothetical protein
MRWVLGWGGVYGALIEVSYLYVILQVGGSAVEACRLDLGIELCCCRFYWLCVWEISMEICVERVDMDIGKDSFV